MSSTTSVTSSNQGQRGLDVAIMGGGLAGLTCALQLKLARPDTEIVVIEKSSFPHSEAAHKVGESTVEVAAHYFTEVLGLGKHFAESQLPKLGLRYFFQTKRGTELDKRVELGSNSLFPRETYQIDRGRFENFLAEQCREKGVTIVESAHVRDCDLGTAGAMHTVSYDSADGPAQVRARWVVDTSGRAAVLKRKLDLKQECAHNINAVWFRINTKINIDDWCEGHAWSKENSGETSRWFSTNHLMGPGYWVWLIPLSSGSTSVGIVADPRYHPLNTMNSFALAMEWLDRHEPQCSKAIRECKGELQDFLALKDFARRSKQVFSHERWVLAGDAGVFIDPLYSPGSDFIGFSNSFITDLVTRDLEGKNFAELSKIYNELLLSFADNTFRLYTDQYEMLGNPVVMPTKVVWDFAAYWSLYGFIFNHGKLCDLNLLSQTHRDLALVSRMNSEMQDFFREWHRVESSDIPRTFIDVTKIPLLKDLNGNLVKSFNEDEFAGVLKSNLQKLTTLGHEIVEKVLARHAQLKRPSFATESGEKGSYLEDFFSKVGLA